jgi:hypothetical protein
VRDLPHIPDVIEPIVAHRVWELVLDGDVEGTVEMAKEMAETVAKAVVDALGRHVWV